MRGAPCGRSLYRRLRLLCGFAVIQDDHERILRIGREGTYKTLRAADRGDRLQRLGHVDGHVRALGLLRVIRNSQLHAGGGCGYHHPWNLLRLALHGRPDLVRIFLGSVHQQELAVR